MRTAPEAIAAANAQRTNSPGMCQRNTWSLYQSHAVGDVDHDGDADAVDGWRSEPASARHTGRRPKIGAPCAWAGGSGGFGHRAICVAYKDGVPMIRSTDAGGRGVMATKPLSWFEENWHLRWLGSSDTISGQPIQGLKAAPAKGGQPKVTANVDKPPSRLARIRAELLDAARTAPTARRRHAAQAAANVLKGIK